MTSRGRVRGSLNVQALVAIVLLVVWGLLLVATGVFAAQGQTPPSQFDYDEGMLPPSTADRVTATAQGIALIGSLPVSAVALWLSMRSLRLWKEQVSAVIAAVLSSTSTLVSIALAWLGVGTLVFFS